MKTGTFLDLDMTSLAGLLRNGWRWWVEEMTALLPLSQKKQARPVIGSIVHLLDDGGLDLEDAPLSPAGRRAQPATLLLPEGHALVRPIALPALRLTDLRKLVEFDLDRLMPFAAGSAYSDVAITDSERDADGKIQAKIAAAPKARLESWYQAAVDQGFSPRAIGIASEDGKYLDFDFLPALVANGKAAARNGAQRWWVLVAILFAANVGVMIWKDVQSVSRLQALVDAQQPMVTAARKLSLRLTNEDKMRSELIATRQRDNPLAALAFTTRTLPAGAWVQRYSWTGESLRITGYKQEKVDVLGALRKTGNFATVRASTSDVAAEAATGQPFDITADWKSK